MSTDNPDRFFDLAMMKIAGHASESELAELEELLSQEPGLKEEYERLARESLMMTEVMPMVRAIREEKESLAEQPDRFFALAMQKISGQATDAGLADLDGLLAADASLQDEYDRLSAESQLLKEALPLAAATQAAEGEFPEWARENLQLEVQHIFITDEGEETVRPPFWSRFSAFVGGGITALIVISSFTHASFLELPRSPADSHFADPTGNIMITTYADFLAKVLFVFGVGGGVGLFLFSLRGRRNSRTDVADKFRRPALASVQPSGFNFWAWGLGLSAACAVVVLVVLNTRTGPGEVDVYALNLMNGLTYKNNSNVPFGRASIPFPPSDTPPKYILVEHVRFGGDLIYNKEDPDQFPSPFTGTDLIYNKEDPDQFPSPFTGTVVEFFDKERKIKKREVPVNLGKHHGTVTWWHKKGTKQFEAEYVKGEPHGIMRWYRENGSVEYEGVWQDNKLVRATTWTANDQQNGQVLDGTGTLIYLHANGQKRLEETFTDGKNTKKLFWDENGNPVEPVEPKYILGSLVKATELLGLAYTRQQFATPRVVGAQGDHIILVDSSQSMKGFINIVDKRGKLKPRNKVNLVETQLVNYLGQIPDDGSRVYIMYFDVGIQKLNGKELATEFIFNAEGKKAAIAQAKKYSDIVSDFALPNNTHLWSSFHKALEFAEKEKYYRPADPNAGIPELFPNILLLSDGEDKQERPGKWVLNAPANNPNMKQAVLNVHPWLPKQDRAIWYQLGVNLNVGWRNVIGTVHVVGGTGNFELPLNPPIIILGGVQNKPLPGGGSIAQAKVGQPVQLIAKGDPRYVKYHWTYTFGKGKNSASVPPEKPVLVKFMNVGIKTITLKGETKKGIRRDLTWTAIIQIVGDAGD